MYRLKQGTHYRMENGSQVRVEVGSVFEPTDAELAAFADRLERVPEQVDIPVVEVAFGEETHPWLKIDLPPAEGFQTENLQPAEASLADYPGIGPKGAAALAAAGVTTLETLKAVASGQDPNLPAIEDIKGISKSMAQKLRLILAEQEQ